MKTLQANILTKKSQSLGDIFFEDDLLVFSLKTHETKNWAIKAYQKDKKDFTTVLEEGLFSNFHVYGGGAFLFKEGFLYYCKEDKSLYKKELKSNVEKKVWIPQSQSYLGDYDAKESHIFCVERELLDEGDESQHILYIDSKTGKSLRVQSDADFYSSPKISHCGRYLAWLEWQNPNMPWELSKLCYAVWDKDSKTLSVPIKVTNKGASFQPSWQSDGFLYYVNDESGYWNLYRYSPTDYCSERLFNERFDCGRPHWTYGSRVYDFLNKDEIILSFVREGLWSYGIFHLKTRKIDFLNHDEKICTIENVSASNGDFAILGASQSESMSLYMGSDKKSDSLSHLVSNQKVVLSKNEISKAKSVKFKSFENRDCFAFYYEPTEGKGPFPVIIKCHGGPQTQAHSSFDLKLQFYLSHGYAYFDLNYTGSTGFGRKYREDIQKNWGRTDVRDLLASVDYLTKNENIDKSRIILLGSSAGGFTILNALLESHKFFAAILYYPVSDAMSLTKAEDCFERYYCHSLIGDPHLDKELFKSRSPYYSQKSINTPTLIFHGDSDPIVPLEQSLLLKEKHKIIKLYIYKGEKHGFSDPENIVDAKNKEILFLESHKTQV